MSKTGYRMVVNGAAYVLPYAGTVPVRLTHFSVDADFGGVALADGKSGLGVILVSTDRNLPWERLVVGPNTLNPHINIYELEPEPEPLPLWEITWAGGGEKPGRYTVRQVPMPNLLSVIETVIRSTNTTLIREDYVAKPGRSLIHRLEINQGAHDAKVVMNLIGGAVYPNEIRIAINLTSGKEQPL